MEKMVTWRADALDVVLLRALKNVREGATTSEVLRHCVKEEIKRHPTLAQDFAAVLQNEPMQPHADDTPPVLFDEADSAGIATMSREFLLIQGDLSGEDQQPQAEQVANEKSKGHEANAKKLKRAERDKARRLTAKTAEKPTKKAAKKPTKKAAKKA